SHQRAEPDIRALRVDPERVGRNARVDTRQAFELIDVLSHAFSRARVIGDKPRILTEASGRNARSGTSLIGTFLSQRILQQCKEPAAIRTDRQSLKTTIPLPAAHDRDGIEARVITSVGITRHKVARLYKRANERTVRQEFVDGRSIFIRDVEMAIRTDDEPLWIVTASYVLHT